MKNKRIFVTKIIWIILHTHGGPHGGPHGILHGGPHGDLHGGPHGPTQIGQHGSKQWWQPPHCKS